MQITIDRIEGEIAIVELENGETLNLPFALFAPLGAKEGDVLRISIDAEETAQRKAHIASLLQGLFQE